MVPEFCKDSSFCDPKDAHPAINRPVMVNTHNYLDVPICHRIHRYIVLCTRDLGYM